MMKKMKIGQIGIGHNHGEGKMLAVQKFPELFEVIGYAEENQAWLEKRGQLPCYKDLPRMSVEELLEQCDAVLVETDVWDLTATAQKCIDAGKHIHLDKPLSGELDAYKKVLDTAKEKNLVVQLGYMYRYNPAIKQCIKDIKNGKLGEIYSINAEMSTRHSKDFRQWLGNFPSGNFFIFGCHFVDLIVYLLGEPEHTATFCQSTGLDDIRSIDVSQAILTYPNTMARIYISSVEHNGWGRRQFVLSGSKGTLEIKPLENPCRMFYADATIAPNAYADMKEQIPVSETPMDCRYDEMMQDFYAYVMGEKENPYSYEHDYKVQKVLSKIVQGAEKSCQDCY